MGAQAAYLHHLTPSLQLLTSFPPPSPLPPTPAVRPIMGSPMFNWYLRSMGAKVGKGVCALGCNCAELDMVTIGDGCGERGAVAPALRQCMVACLGGAGRGGMRGAHATSARLSPSACFPCPLTPRTALPDPTPSPSWPPTRVQSSTSRPS